MRKPVLSHRSLSQNPDPCIAGCDMEPIAGDIAEPGASLCKTLQIKGLRAGLATPN